MTTVQILFRDTDDGLVDVETTVTSWDENSNAQALASRVNQFLSEIAERKDRPYVMDVTPKNEPSRIILTQ